MAKKKKTTSAEPESLPPLRLEWVLPETLDDNPANWRTHPAPQMAALEGAMAEVGWAGALLYNEATQRLVDGHARKKLALGKGELVPVLVGNWTEAQEQTILATLDPIAAMATADSAKLDALLRDVQTGSQAVADMLTDLAEKARLVPADTATPAVEPSSPLPASASLSERFLVPPFSVLDARQGYWQERKRQWLALGIQSELGRGDVMPSGASSVDAGRSPFCDNRGGQRVAPGGSPRPAASLGEDGRTERGDGKGRKLARTDGSGGPGDLGAKFSGTLAPGRNGRQGAGDCQDGTPAGTGTSIFDPVLCELAYRWFCPPTGAVLDPFAGGSVRGIVAAKLGRNYTGIDLSAAQLAANEEQAARIVPNSRPRWLAGDSRDIATLAPGEYDFAFSCPPYADLERYSDDPRDLSAMDYPAFLDAYRAIIAAACGLLREDRFACFVVGDVRDKAGLYRNFVGDTVAAFRDAGLALYNDAVLVTMVGSLPLRVGRQFGVYRKLGKTHQNVLVFVKGCPAKASATVGPVEVEDLANQFGEVLDVPGAED